MRHLVRFEGERSFVDPVKLQHLREHSFLSKAGFKRLAHVERAGVEEPHAKDEIGERNGLTMLPFPPVVLVPNGLESLSTQPQIPFRPRRFVLGVCADRVNVESFRIGRDEITLACGTIPGRLIAPLPIGLSLEDRGLYESLLRLKFPVADIGQSVRIIVRSTSDAPVVVYATMLGDAIEPVR